MTIRFNCPKCNELIAFDSKHTGRRARCLTCGQIFIIPAKDNEKPKAIQPPKVEKGPPVPGFYKALFVDTWKIFFDRESQTPLVFVTAVICFKFFLAGACCLNVFAFVVGWGWLLGFYLNVIYETAYEIDKLPEIYIGTSVTVFWYVIKPFLVFAFTAVVVLLPYLVALGLASRVGVTAGDLLRFDLGLHAIPQAFFIIGLFFFPAAVLTMAIGQDITLLRPDYLLPPAFKAFIPYCVVFVLLAAAFLFQTQLSQFNLDAKTSPFGVALDLALNLVGQIIAIASMRSIGLFYRHYCCFFKW